MRNILYLHVLSMMLYIYPCNAQSKAQEVNTDYYFTDKRDNQKYGYTKIGEQYWFSENLKFKTKDCIRLNINDSTRTMRGYYYSIQEALSACPDGWRLPSDEDWSKLEEFLKTPGDVDSFEGQSIGFMRYRKSDIGDKLKMDFWRKTDEPIEEIGFNATPDGYYYIKTKESLGVDKSVDYWTSTKEGIFLYTIRILDIEYKEIGIQFNGDNYKLPVRCVR